MQNLSKENAALIFSMAKITMPSVASDEDIRQALLKIQQQIDPKAAKKASSQEEKKSVLVVDDVGVVTYQLKVMFEKNNFEVETSKDVFSAIDLFKKESFNYVVTDLFVSTEREGYFLLDEVKKIVIAKNLNTKIIVITASTKGEYKIKCINKGANAFIEKTSNWQDELLSICSS